MSTITLSLHVSNGETIPSWLNLPVSNGIIGYSVESGDQITLPNRNMLLKTDSVLAGWCESQDGTGMVYKNFYEPTEGHADLWPVWIPKSSVGFSATIAGKTSVTTTVTPYDELGTDAKADADIARSAFNLEVSSQVSAAVGTIIDSELEPMIRDQVDAVVGSIVDDHLSSIDARISSVNGRVDALGTRVDSLETSNAENTSAIGSLIGSVASIGSEVNRIGEMTDIFQVEISSISTQVNRLSTTVEYDGARITELGTNLDITMGSVVSIGSDVDSLNTRFETMASSVGAIDTKIGSIDDNILEISSGITTISSSISDIMLEISTQAIQEKAGSTSSDIAAKMANTVTFRLDVGTKTEAVCTLSSQYDYKRVKTLADYKTLPEYSSSFGTNVIWYDNGKLLDNLSPISSGSVLIGIVPLENPRIYALPVVIGSDDEHFDLSSQDEKAATNYGVVRIMSEENVMFDSSKSYNACVVSTESDIIRLRAEEKGGCYFSGWYVISTETKEGGEPHEQSVVAKYLATKESELIFESVEDLQYAALFEGEPEEDFYTQLTYTPSDSPLGYCITYQCLGSGNSFDDDYGEGRISTHTGDWRPMGSYTTFMTDEINENDSILVVVPQTEGLHAAYKRVGIDGPVYLTKELGEEETAADMVNAITSMFPGGYNVFGVRNIENLQESDVIVKITFDNE